MTKHFFVLVFIILGFTTVAAQQKAVFTNNNSGKIVVVKQNDLLKLVYRGYLGQMQEIYGRVDNINDSFIRFDNNWTVRISDILGFRRFSKYRDVLKGAVDVVVLVGAIVVVPILIYSTPNLSLVERLGISVGIGTAASLATNWIFSSKIKNIMSAGWVVKVE
jgi:hypothetical protein